MNQHLVRASEMYALGTKNPHSESGVEVGVGFGRAKATAPGHYEQIQDVEHCSGMVTGDEVATYSQICRFWRADHQLRQTLSETW